MLENMRFMFLRIDCFNKKHLFSSVQWRFFLRRVSGIDGKESLEYSSHPQRASGGLMDRLDLELKSLDFQNLLNIFYT